MIFIIIVSMLIGLLGSVTASATGAPTWLAVTIGALAGVVYFLSMTLVGGVRFYSLWGTYRPLKPTPESEGS
jgi:hypothetical protein